MREDRLTGIAQKFKHLDASGNGQKLHAGAILAAPSLCNDTEFFHGLDQPVTRGLRKIGAAAEFTTRQPALGIAKRFQDREGLDHGKISWCRHALLSTLKWLKLPMPVEAAPGARIDEPVSISQ